MRDGGPLRSFTRLLHAIAKKRGGHFRQVRRELMMRSSSFLLSACPEECVCVYVMIVQDSWMESNRALGARENSESKQRAIGEMA